MGAALLALQDELAKRPHGGRISRMLSLLPVVGVAGKYCRGVVGAEEGRQGR